MEIQEKGHRLLKNALEILDYVADSPEPITFNNLKQQFKLSKSSIYNLLQTMLLTGYLERDSAGHYSIGIRCFRTGSAFRVSNPFERRAKEVVEGINTACKETVHFAVLQDTDVVYIYKFDSIHALRIYSQVGKKIPAHTTAIGKAMLSGYSDEELRSFYMETKLVSLTPKSITSFRVLLEQMHEVRRTSIAYEQEESTPDVKCVAVPIMNSKKIPVAGISVAFPVYREDKEVEKVIPLLLKAKKDLEDLYAMYE
ncbi:MAG: IclR family transcriptional regulator [Treponema sp.]|jgi:DNA-binding IclR family transcriptional regulator|nr:IclR family transcriptional regulator [Treponema sp.]